MKIIIPGDPIPQKRHRHVRRGLHIQTYDPSSKDKESIVSQISELKLSMPKKGAYLMHCTFEMPIAESTPLFKKNLMLWGLIPHITKPDNSNCLKLYEDAFNEILYPDDSHIIFSSQKKLYSLEPKTIIEVIPLPEVKLNEQSQEIFKLISPKQIEDMCQLALNIENCQLNAKKAQLEPRYGIDRIQEAADEYYACLDILAHSIYEFSEKYSSTLARIRKSTSYEA